MHTMILEDKKGFTKTMVAPKRMDQLEIAEPLPPMTWKAAMDAPFFEAIKTIRFRMEKWIDRDHDIALYKEV